MDQAILHFSQLLDGEEKATEMKAVCNQHGARVDTNSDEEYEESEDYGEYDNSSSGDESDSDDDSDDDDDQSVDLYWPPAAVPAGTPARNLLIHNPIVHDSRHCPPAELAMFTGLGHACNCVDGFLFEACCLQNNYADLQGHNDLDFTSELVYAQGAENDGMRDANNIQRKRMYSLVFHAIDWGGRLEKGERRPLPNCAVASIRSIYPSATGFYMGFKES
jgi:hypothetical protein